MFVSMSSEISSSSLISPSSFSTSVALRWSGPEGRDGPARLLVLMEEETGGEETAKGLCEVDGGNEVGFKGSRARLSLTGAFPLALLMAAARSAEISTKPSLRGSNGTLLVGLGGRLADAGGVKADGVPVGGGAGGTAALMVEDAEPMSARPA